MSNNIDIYVNKNKYNVDFKYSKKTNTTVDIDLSKSGDKFFKFTQSVASDIWEITHNLNKYPSVTIVDSANTVIVGEVDYINVNEVRLRFTAPFSGKAYLN